MTTLYLDTESTGIDGHLISMAMVSDDGREFYEVKFWGMVPPTPWVTENVIPKLGKKPIGMPEFRAALSDYLAQFTDPLIVCDWPADLAYLFSLLVGHNFETSVNYRCRALLLDRGPGSDWPNPLPHNALSDARALRDWHMGRKAA